MLWTFADRGQVFLFISDSPLGDLIIKRSTLGAALNIIMNDFHYE
jgi:hypothetical protein